MGTVTIKEDKRLDRLVDVGTEVMEIASAEKDPQARGLAYIAIAMVACTLLIMAGVTLLFMNDPSYDHRASQARIQKMHEDTVVSNSTVPWMDLTGYTAAMPVLSPNGLEFDFEHPTMPYANGAMFRILLNCRKVAPRDGSPRDNWHTATGYTEDAASGLCSYSIPATAIQGQSGQRFIIETVFYLQRASDQKVVPFPPQKAAYYTIP